MDQLLAFATTLLNFLLVVLGFSAIIFLHELGHFVAARWAGIRVQAFAIGLGPAIVSYRPGMGWRRGSSETDYRRLRENGLLPAAISPTEYRFNWVLFGGYVKMLGQEDGDASAISDEPDSYQRCVPWKRMVVISAGVIMNLITAAILFVVVFTAGLKVMPAKIGVLEPGLPAARALATNAKDLGLSDADAHLRPGDRVLLVGGEKPNSFSDVMIAGSMAGRGQPVEFTVERPGVAGSLSFSVVPEENRLTGLLDLGLDGPRSGTIGSVDSPREADEFAALLAKNGLPGVLPGMRLIAAGELIAPAGESLTAADYTAAFRGSGGRPVQLTFASDWDKVTVTAIPKVNLQSDLVLGRNDTRVPVDHLLGLTPVMTVARGNPDKGLNDGDIFARVGAVEYPSLAQGMAEIQGHAGKTIDLTVLRETPEGSIAVDLKAKVDGNGRIGFNPGTTADDSTLVSRPPTGFVGAKDASRSKVPPASALELRPGSRIVAVGDLQVSTFAELRAALVKQTSAAAENGSRASLTLTVKLSDPQASERKLPWVLGVDEIRALHALGWRPPASVVIFDPEEVILRGASPVDSIRLGLRETRRVMLQTYLTFARLFEGTVKIEHLQGPVGIAHVGTLLAKRGLVWLLFFMALISVNLAVVNFLPLPIVDGGQFLMILYEQIRGKPLPIRVQEMVTIAGLVFIGAMFLLVTFNDIRKIFSV